jgi:hypothetical protein
MQFSLRTLLLFATGVALFCVVVRWLLVLLGDELFQVTTAGSVGILIGLSVGFVSKMEIATMNVLHVSVVALSGMYFSAHFGSHMMGVLTGVLATHFPQDLLIAVNSVLHASGLTIRSEQDEQCH